MLTKRQKALVGRLQTLQSYVPAVAAASSLRQRLLSCDPAAPASADLALNSIHTFCLAFARFRILGQLIPNHPNMASASARERQRQRQRQRQRGRERERERGERGRGRGGEGERGRGGEGERGRGGEGERGRGGEGERGRGGEGERGRGREGERGRRGRRGGEGERERERARVRELRCGLRLSNLTLWRFMGSA